MTWTQETGNKELQVKNCHLKKNVWKKIVSKKGPEKEWHLGKMIRNEETESKKIQLKNWHLKKMIGTKNSEAKRSTKKGTP